jgi:hypothetical protein
MEKSVQETQKTGLYPCEQRLGRDEFQTWFLRYFPAHGGTWRPAMEHYGVSRPLSDRVFDHFLLEYQQYIHTFRKCLQYG